MPIYEYQCDTCDAVFEQIHPIKDCDKSVPCEKCEKGTAKRIISTNTFHLKGIGWAEHGYISAGEKFSGAMKAVDTY